MRSGIRTLVDPASQADRAAHSLPDLPEPRLVARAQAGVQVASSAALIVDIAPRLAAAALAATLIPVTYVGHPFWTSEDPQQRNQQITQFLKNLGLFGGLLLVALPDATRLTPPIRGVPATGGSRA